MISCLLIYNSDNNIYDSDNDLDKVSVIVISNKYKFLLQT